MNDPTGKVYLMIFVVCAIVCTGFIVVIFNFMRTLTTPPSYAPAWMIVILVLIFTSILVLFISSLYVLILMLGLAELRSQWLDIRLKSEQAQQKTSSQSARLSPGTMPIRRRQPGRFTLRDE